MKLNRNDEYISFFQSFSYSHEYRTIQKYFYKSDCVSCHMIGHISELIRKSKATTICEWHDFYKTTIYYPNLSLAASNLQMTLAENDLFYSIQTVLLCLKTFIIYKAWIGCQKEQEAMNIFNDENYYSLYPHPAIDLRYGVDFVLVYNGRYRIGIQVKPTSYIESVRDRERMKAFYRKYKVPVFYLHYNSKTQQFLQSDIDFIEKQKQLIIEKESSN